MMVLIFVFRRDRIMNKWSIMARKRIKNEIETDDIDDEGNKSKSKGKKKKDKSLVSNSFHSHCTGPQIRMHFGKLFS